MGLTWVSTSILWSHIEWELPSFGLHEWTTWSVSPLTGHRHVIWLLLARKLKSSERKSGKFIKIPRLKWWPCCWEIVELVNVMYALLFCCIRRCEHESFRLFHFSSLHVHIGFCSCLLCCLFLLTLPSKVACYHHLFFVLIVDRHPTHMWHKLHATNFQVYSTILTICTLLYSMSLIDWDGTGDWNQCFAYALNSLY